MSEIYFTSDTHYNHSNISGKSASVWSRGYRNFDSLNDMNQAIIDSMNQAKEDDTIYHLGDLAFGKPEVIEEMLSQIRCKNIIIILGNHDKYILHCKDLFKAVHPTWEGHIRGRHFVLHHYANRVWNKQQHGAIMLYGHSHGTLPDDPKVMSIDVGWDTELFGHPKHTMYTYDEIIDIMAKHKQL